ncbi:hypothetical protein ACM66B_002680 [Microbotryomycetes sp. NB124-2]
MDKLSSFASQAKAKSDAVRLGAMNKIDNQFTPHRTASPSQSQSTAPSSSAPPPPAPPPRSRAGSSAASTLPPATHHATSNGLRSQAGPVFTNLDSRDKQAFFALLDEYFQSRPQYRDLLGQANGAHATATVAPAPTQPHVVTPAAVAPPPPPPPPRQQTRGIGTATAMYDFEGQTAEDLPFKEHDKITVLEHITTDWWRGELNGRTGMFPCSYVQVDQ